MINQALKIANHTDIVFSYIQVQSRIQVNVPPGKILRMKNDSPSLIMGLSEIATGKTYDVAGKNNAGIVKTLPYAVDLSAGRISVQLHRYLIYPAVEYEDNSDSRVLKSFLIKSSDGINNYTLEVPDPRLLQSNQQITEISFWLKYNAGEHITSGYPIFLDLRIRDVKT